MCVGVKCSCVWQLGCGLVSCFSVSSGRSMSVGGGVDVLLLWGIVCGEVGCVNRGNLF